MALRRRLARATAPHKVWTIQFLIMACLNGGPALSTTPESIYSKHDVRNKAVLSEFLMFDFSLFTTGGMYLCPSISWKG